MIDPLEISTIRVGQLPSAPISLTDNIPHEVGSELHRATIEELSIFIATYVGTVGGVGFRPITVADGQTLPTTTQKEWILVGKGTFYNVNGGATIVTTEELNAIMSNGFTWSLGVEIPIAAELIGIVQTIRESFTTTAPSEDAVFKALALKANISDIPIQNYLIEQLDFEANGIDNFIDIGTTYLVKSFFYGSVLQLKSDWSQIGSIVTFTFIPEAGAGIKNLSFI